jgi:hypothetical protein
MAWSFGVHQRLTPSSRWRSAFTRYLIADSVVDQRKAGSLMSTDPMGKVDLPDHPDARLYLLSNGVALDKDIAVPAENCPVLGGKNEARPSGNARFPIPHNSRDLEGPAASDVEHDSCWKTQFIERVRWVWDRHN